MKQFKTFCDECGKEIYIEPKDAYSIKFGHYSSDMGEFEFCIDCGQKHIDYLNSIKKNNPDSK